MIFQGFLYPFWVFSFSFKKDSLFSLAICHVRSGKIAYMCIYPDPAKAGLTLRVVVVVLSLAILKKGEGWKKFGAKCF